MDKIMENKKIIAIAIIAALAIGGASFYGGMLVGKGRCVFGGGSRGAFNGAGGTNSAGAKRATGASYINGEILSVDASSLTVKLINGGSKIVLFGTSTEVGKFTTGALSDLTVGTSVMINGNATADGSLTAKSIQIRPAGTAGEPGPQGAGQPGGQNPANQ